MPLSIALNPKKRERISTVTHNHPAELGLSIPDMIMSSTVNEMNKGGFKEVRAITYGDKLWRLSVKDKWPAIQKTAQAIDDSYDTAYKRALYIAKETNDKVRTYQTFQNELGKEVAKKTNLKYTQSTVSKLNKKEQEESKKRDAEIIGKHEFVKEIYRAVQSDLTQNSKAKAPTTFTSKWTKARIGSNMMQYTNPGRYWLGGGTGAVMGYMSGSYLGDIASEALPEYRNIIKLGKVFAETGGLVLGMDYGARLAYLLKSKSKKK